MALGPRGWRTARVAGHLGEFLQGRVDGEVVLVTLPAPILAVTARWRAGPDPLRVTGGLLTRPALRALFSVAGRPLRGVLRLSADMPPGGGAGASTAALLAVAGAVGLSLDERLAPLCLGLEGATDPLMLPAPGQVLWASRRAEVRARLDPVPSFDVVGGFHGAPRQTRAGDERFADISDLVTDWRAAGPDRARLAELATESARRNQALRGGEDIAPLMAMARDCGALGLAAAHTGSARGLLFAPGEGDRRRAARMMKEAGVRGIVTFRTPGPL